MNSLEASVLSYLLNSAWQVPLVFTAGWIAARLVRRVGPQAEHTVWVAALLLEVTLPACTLRLSELVEHLRAMLPSGWSGPAGRGAVHISITAEAGQLHSLLQLPPAVRTSVAAAYGCCLCYFALRLCWGLRQTFALDSAAQRIALPVRLTELWTRSCRNFGVSDARLALSSTTSGPVTLGIGRPVLLLPADLMARASDEDLEAVMAHECAHMARHDFAKNLVYGVVSLPIAYHPLFWLTRTCVAGSREMVCDELAAGAIATRGMYARSLLRLASMLAHRTPADLSHAIGIFDANILERRLMNLTQRHDRTRGVGRFAMAALCGVIALGTCASALALRLNVDAAQQAAAHGPLMIDSNALKSIYKKPPVYPIEAKAKKDTLDGPVVLAVVISKEGVVEQINVSKSLRADYDRSALDAVRDWRWEPYLLNGDPVEVKANITINYSLQP